MNSDVVDQIPHLSLSQLAGEVGRTVEQAFHKKLFWVIADVANHSFKAQSNHHYFDLVEKDKDTSSLVAKIATRSWSEGSRYIASFEAETGQQFTNNLNVLVQASVSFNAVYGLQLTLINIDPNFTLGALEKEKRSTLIKLVRDNAAFIRMEKDSYVTFNQELPLPLVIQRVAVISSSTSAGLEDFTHTLQSNNYHYQFRIDPYYSVVQGELNAQYVVDQLIAIYNSGITYDVVVVIRGGGSQTDLLLFEQYAIGRAIARFPVPVITGIGHHKNETVADLMAHTALKTPTKAGEFIVAHNKSFADELESIEKNIIIRTQRLLAKQHALLSTLNQQLTKSVSQFLNAKQQRLHLRASAFLRKPGLILYEKQRDIETQQSKIKLSSSYYLKGQQSKLENYTSLMKLMSPENVLRKGFALVKHQQKIVNNAEGIDKNSEIAIILSKHEITATVTNKKEYDGNDFNI